jgi:threonine synthase
MLSVSNPEIIFAKEMVLEDEGIIICHAAATAVAAIYKLALKDPSIKSQNIVINLSGGVRDIQEPSTIDRWLQRSGDAWG